MNTPQGFEITLRGSSFLEVLTQARTFVEEATAFELAPQEVKTRTKTTAKKVAPPIEDDGPMLADADADADDLMSFDDADDDSETEEKPAKKATAKTKKLTEKDVNTAAMEYSKMHGRKKTLAVLTKKFKVKSILELKPEQYETVIEALEV